MNNNQRKTKYQDKYNKKFPYQWFQYCIEPLENIEGFFAMVNDKSGQLWHLHHRDEIKGEVVVSRDDLDRIGELYNLSANKLIFLTKSDHMSLHMTGKNHHSFGINKYGITPEALYYLYVVKGITRRKIAEKFDCSHGLIGWYLRKYNIKR